VHEPEDMSEQDSHYTYAPPRYDVHPSLSFPMVEHTQSAFYAGIPAHRDAYEISSVSVDSQSSRPKMRARPSSYQTDEMRKLYARNPHPSREEREELCVRIDMYVLSIASIFSNPNSHLISFFAVSIFRRYQSVTNWFQNQRSMAKRRMEEAQRSERSTPMSKSHRFSPFPSATDHSLPQSLSVLLHRDISPAPSATGSMVSSRTSPHPELSSRPRRSRPTPYQLDMLKTLYRQTPSPSIEERTALASEIGM
jgi:hypothetical protein